jgi:hypothetical protein
MRWAPRPSGPPPERSPGVEGLASAKHERPSTARLNAGATQPECPVEAIFDEAQLPDDKTDWTAINAEKSPTLPVINAKADPLPGAEARKQELGF